MAQTLNEMSVPQERGRPGHPQDNGAHERLHRDISLAQLSLLGANFAYFSGSSAREAA